MSLLATTSSRGRSLASAQLCRAGPSFSTTPATLQGKALPATDWSRPSGSSTSNRNIRNQDTSSPQPRGPRAPRRPNAKDAITPAGGGPRNNRPNGGFGMGNRNRFPAQPPPGDLQDHLKKWNVSAVSKPSNSATDKEAAPSRPSAAERFGNSNNQQDEPDLDNRHGRRLKPGERGESRSFDAVRRSSSDGDFSLNRNSRQGSKKGKEREHAPRDLARKGPTDKPKAKTGQKVKATEKEVYIPSTVTVSRLADIFGVKICMYTQRVGRAG
jgi:hypothetical protein